MRRSRHLPFPSLRLPRSGSQCHGNREAQWTILADPKERNAWPAAEEGYNAAVRILFDKLRCGGGDWTSRAARIGTAISAPETMNEDLSKIDALFPATAVKLRSDYRQHRDEALGIPAVAWTATSPVRVPRPAFQPPNGQPRNVTVTLDFGTTRCRSGNFPNAG